MTVMLRSVLPTLILLLVIYPFLDAGRYQPCGCWCVCNKHYQKAKCVDHGLDLVYVPKIPKYVTDLVFARNYLPAISEESFRNITASRITKLSLASNRMEYVTPKSFAPFINLKRLNLSDNAFGPKGLKIIFADLVLLPLRNLTLGNLNLTSTQVVGNLQSKTLSTVSLLRNDIMIYNQSDFQYIPNLTSLLLNYNQIRPISLSTATTLSYLQLGDNYIFEFPNFCTPNGTYFPNLASLKLDHNSLRFIPNNFLKCLKSLRLLTLNSNPIFQILSNTFSELPELEILIVQNIRETVRIEGYAFNNSNIKYISLASGGIDFPNKVQMNAFKSLPNLNTLTVSYNQFLESTDEDFHGWFGHLTNLTGFAIAGCQITTLPTFIPTLKKLQYLELYDNYMEGLPDGAFNDLTSLTHLWISNNHIPRLTQEAFPKEVCERLKVVSFAYNPFVCDCKLRWFLNWTRYERPKFKLFPRGYVCNSPQTLTNKPLSDIHFRAYTCIVPVAVSMSIVWCSCLILMCFVISTLIVRFRWKIRYTIYKWKVQNDHFRRLAERELKYGAYVVYNIQDINWIKDELIPNVEDDIKLYIRDRDSLAGDPKVHNVVNNMASSRTCLVILSNYMAGDEECLFELMFAQGQINSATDFRISLVLLEEVHAINVSGSIYALLKMNSYISWVDDLDARYLFWNRLRRELEFEQRRD